MHASLSDIVADVSANSIEAGAALVQVFVLDDKEAQIVAKDRGPGIKDVEWALQDGTSTANDWIRSMGFGAGMGLANSKRVSDTFDIMSKVPTGTMVMCGFKLRA